MRVKYKKPVLIVLLTMIMILCFAVIAMAAGSDMVSVDAGLSATGKEALATKVKDIVIGIGYFIGVVAVAALIFGGFKLATVGGNEQKLAEVKRQITYAIGGVILVALSLMIIGFIASLVAGGHTTALITKLLIA